LKYPWPQSIISHYRRLIDPTDSQDPLAKMVFYDSREENIAKTELLDPIGDQKHQVLPCLIHRYPGSVLVLTTPTCPQNCRFCFRRCLPPSPPPNWSKISAYIQKHPQIKEIIFSGGDPLTLTNPNWIQIIKNLKPIKHLHFFRLHSRLPIADPQALSPDFFSLWPDDKNLTLVVHVNHPREISPQTIKLLKTFRQHGWHFLSQTVLLKGVNDNSQVLKKLFLDLWQNGVKPYYLHHLDSVPGTSHFRLSISRGLKLFTGLRGHLPGPALPTYVLDLPGGFGKVPVSWLKKIGPKKYQVKNFQEKTIIYTDPF